jgi:hypothetical protein
MLDGIGDIYLPAVDPCLRQQPVEEAASRTDKRATLPVFDIAGLLAHKEHLGRWRPFSKDGLSRASVERTSLATDGCPAKGGKISPAGQKVSRRFRMRRELHDLGGNEDRHRIRLTQ